MSSPSATIKGEDDPWGDSDLWVGSGLCLICTLPIRVPGGDPDALQCWQCKAVYHMVCAEDWADECASCRSRDAIKAWARPAAPGPGVEVVQIKEEEEAEEVSSARMVTVRRGKVKWGAGVGRWYDVERRANTWTYVEGGLKVAKVTLKTLVESAEVVELDAKDIGEVGDEDDMAVKRPAQMRDVNARRPVNRCGVDGCQYVRERGLHVCPTNSSHADTRPSARTT